MNGKRGFTLIEVMVALFLSVIVSLFVYTMMISSYNAYNRLSSVSKNANSIRYFIASFSNSIKYATELPTEVFSGGKTSSLTFKRYDKNYNDIIREKYYFENGSEFVRSPQHSISVTTDTYHCETMGVLKKDIIVGGTVVQTIIISNILRSVYYDIPATTAVFNRFRKMNLGVIYDDVVDGKVNKTTGVMENKTNDETEMKTENTINRRLFCFNFRGFNA